METQQIYGLYNKLFIWTSQFYDTWIVLFLRIAFYFV